MSSASRLPRVGIHKQSGRFRFTILGESRLCPPGITRPEAEALRDRLWAEAKLSGVVPTLPGQRPKPGAEPDSVTVAEVVEVARRWAEDYFGGEPPSHLKIAFKAVLGRYAREPASAFGPLALKVVQQDLVGSGYCRSGVNRYTQWIRRIFKVAAEHEVIDAAIYHRLQVVAAIKRGHTTARETEPRHPAPEHLIDAIEPHVSGVIWAMIQVQKLSGMRPGEVCIMRAADIDMSEKEWEYRPASHKTQNYGHSREIQLGPQAQEIIKPFLTGDSTKFTFDPRDAVAAHQADRAAARKTPMNQGNRKGTNRRRKPKRVVGDCYDVDSYRRAVQRGCDKAFPIPPEIKRIDDPTERLEQAKAWQNEHRWFPHQLRHNGATKARQVGGLEAAQVMLGHSNADVTQTYTERDRKLAKDVARRIG